MPIGVLYHDKVCPECGLTETTEGHDPCIPNLPGVKFACCGHGIQRGYVVFEDGKIIDGFFRHVKYRRADGK